MGQLAECTGELVEEGFGRDFACSGGSFVFGGIFTHVDGALSSLS